MIRARYQNTQKYKLARVILFDSSGDRTDANKIEDFKIFQHKLHHAIPAPKTEVARICYPFLLSIELPERSEWGAEILPVSTNYHKLLQTLTNTHLQVKSPV